LKIDVISDEGENSSFKSNDEILVDAFAAALLMPIGGIQAEFTKRNISFQAATHVDFYTISSVFGVGYQTLITHCKVNRLITGSKAIELSKLTPAKIFKANFKDVEEKSFFKIIDEKCCAKPVDLEVSNYIVLPSDFIVDDEFLERKHEAQIGTLFLAKKTGILSVHSNKTETSYFIRVQPQNYIGFAEYRHLEN
jgi:hypothetical protein